MTTDCALLATYCLLLTTYYRLWCIRELMEAQSTGIVISMYTLAETDGLYAERTFVGMTVR